MSATEGPGGSGGPSGAGAPRLRPSSLYTPTWWERRFPWLLDALAAMDPAPLGRALSTLLLPGRAVVEASSQPLAAALELVGRGIGAAWTGLDRALGATVAALPLPRFVRRSLWLPLREGDFHPLGAHWALRRQHALVLPLALMTAAGTHAGVMTYWPAFALPTSARCRRRS
jgi:hypothetical protein